jgi:hypothetical protein
MSAARQSGECGDIKNANPITTKNIATKTIAPRLNHLLADSSSLSQREHIVRVE